MKKLMMALAVIGLLAGCAREHEKAKVEMRTNHSTNSLTITTNSTP
jgi:uncharacterized lipoprotein YajG